eukprot:6943377-Alexandrium_andersonii.AAC.1
MPIKGCLDGDARQRDVKTSILEVVLSQPRPVPGSVHKGAAAAIPVEGHQVMVLRNDREEGLQVDVGAQ